MIVYARTVLYYVPYPAVPQVLYSTVYPSVRACVCRQFIPSL